MEASIPFDILLSFIFIRERCNEVSSLYISKTAISRALLPHKRLPELQLYPLKKKIGEPQSQTNRHIRNSNGYFGYT